MPRIRTIKPTHVSDKELAGITLQAHLLWVLSWCFSDDEGIFENDPLLIKSQVFPRRTDVRVTDVSQWLDQLVKARFIIPFDHDGIGYYIHRTFKTHQKIDRPQESKVPFELIRRILDESSTNDRPCIVVDSKVMERSVPRARDPGGNKVLLKKSPKNWIARPGENEMCLPLPEIKSGVVIQLFKITKKSDIDTSIVDGLWNIFKQQNFTGEKYYQSEGEVFKHFINWCKTQTVNGTTTNQQSNSGSSSKSGGKSAGAHQLLDDLREEVAGPGSG